MDSRERTFLTLEHGPADRLPRDFWASDAMIRRIEAESAAPYAAFLDAHDVDLRYIAGPRYGGPPLGQGRDIWGVLRREVQVPTAHGTERYSEVAASPWPGATASRASSPTRAGPRPTTMTMASSASSAAPCARRGAWSASWATGSTAWPSSSRPCTCGGSSRPCSTSPCAPTWPRPSSAASAPSTASTSSGCSRRPPAGSTSSSPVTISAGKGGCSSLRAPGAACCSPALPSTCASSPGTAPSRCTTPAGRWRL